MLFGRHWAPFEPKEGKSLELAELLRKAGIEPGRLPSNPVVRGIGHDSRRVKRGEVFVCIRGQRFDGHNFALQAVGRGACAVVAEEGAPLPGEVGVPVIRVSDTRLALARLSAAFYGFPSRELTLVGVTGTNGKSTVVEMLRAIFEAAGVASARMGTLGMRTPWGEEELSHTTPEAPDLQRALRRLADHGVRAVAMEVSSHSLELKRVVGCEFDVAVFTNLSRDHLDFHGSMEEYGRAKMRLFTEPLDGGPPPLVATNIDDDLGRKIASLAPGRVLTYGFSAKAELRVEVAEVTKEGLKVAFSHGEERHEAFLRLVAPFNALNAAAAAGAALLLGLEWEEILKGLESIRSVPGRFELVDLGQPFTVVVDYAHTPDSLRKVIEAARRICKGKVIVVFGCGGERDPGKRPKMGRIVAELADLVIITNDNPRGERPEEIARAIERGAREARGGRYEIILDRARAIRRAINLAQTGDLVLVAGKGHETYQIIGDKVIPFDDREECRKALREAGYG